MEQARRQLQIKQPRIFEASSREEMTVIHLCPDAYAHRNPAHRRITRTSRMLDSLLEDVPKAAYSLGSCNRS
jgi:hypothetical protein